MITESPLVKLGRTWLDLYPNKVDLEAAGREWVSLVRDEAHGVEVIDGTQRYMESTNWRDRNGEMVPGKAKSPLYFLRDGNYRDNPTPYKARDSPRKTVDASTPGWEWMANVKVEDADEPERI